MGVYLRHRSVKFVFVHYNSLLLLKIESESSSVPLSNPFNNIKVLQMQRSFFGRHYGDSETISVLIQLNYIKSIKSFRRFQVMAYLQQIWWFEVDGLVKFPLPPDTYTLSFRIHLGRFSRRLGRRICNFEHTHGWDVKPVKFELSTSDGQQASSQCYLDESELDYASGNQKRGRWIDYKVGEFMVSDSDLATEVRFSMKQIDCTHSKGGLCLDTVYIIPSDLKSQRRRYGNSK